MTLLKSLKYEARSVLLIQDCSLNSQTEALCNGTNETSQLAFLLIISQTDLEYHFRRRRLNT